MNKESAIKLFEQKLILEYQSMPKASKVCSGNDVFFNKSKWYQMPKASYIYSKNINHYLFDPERVADFVNYQFYTNLVSLRDIKNVEIKTLFCTYTNLTPQTSQIYNNNNIKYKPMPKASKVCNGKDNGVFFNKSKWYQMPKASYVYSKSVNHYLFDPEKVADISCYYSFTNLISLRDIKNIEIKTLFCTYTNLTPQTSQIYNNNNIKYKPMPKASYVYSKSVNHYLFDPERVADFVNYQFYTNLVSLRDIKNIEIKILFCTYTNLTPQTSQIYNNNNIKYKPMPKTSYISNWISIIGMFDPERVAEIYDDIF